MKDVLIPLVPAIAGLLGAAAAYLKARAAHTRLDKIGAKK